MQFEFADVLAALAFLVNGLPVALMAIGYGFASVPTGLAYIVGAAGMLISQQPIPIGFQAESVVLAGEMGKDRHERLNIVFYTGIIMAIMGAFGLLGAVTDFIGPEILYAMMAGVGVILAKAGTNMFKTRPIIAMTSLVTAGIAYFAFDGNPNQMVYMVIISVGISSILHLILMHYGKDENKQPLDVDMSIEKFIPIKLKINPNIVRSTLALCAMQIGANIAFTEVMA
ncbi:MAG: NCS2 family permease, partial [Eubacteriales bacterium]|nr:NCS2 family permease [Eubacteriales bacterium]